MNEVPVDAVERIGTQVNGSLERLFGVAQPNAVFSEPQRVGADLVVMAAAWERIGGFGFGGGRGPAGEEGGGGGGGGTANGRPVAVIRISADGVTVKPVVDITRLGVTLVLGALGVWRVLRRR